MPVAPFHIAFPVDDLESTRAFYGGVLGCPEGRSSNTWIDFDLFGHQVVAHLRSGASAPVHRSRVDLHDVPIPHFGVVLPMDEWNRLADRMKAHHTDFLIQPHVRFQGEIGEQATMFFLDPSGNALEFKAFQDIKQMFAK